MNIILFSHPGFLDYQSMPRFTNMLFTGMQERGHSVEVWMPKPFFFNLPVPKSIKKWMGYLDQYILFPGDVKRKLRQCTADTLFVFTDQALGPWVPLAASRQHVIHCHDFLAQRSALGEIKENPTSWTGSKYQAYIRNGYRQGRNFISVSQRTKGDLHRFLGSEPALSEVVYNGLNQSFKVIDKTTARQITGDKTKIDLLQGYLLHVGGNQFYKNRSGVIEIYNAWRNKSNINLPLLLIGEAPSAGLINLQNQSDFKDDIYFLTHLSDQEVRMAYAGASVFLFPSLAEGFGWPIAEAMASGTPVITTNDTPMTEVAGEAGFLIPLRPIEKDKVPAWANAGADVVNRILNLPEVQMKEVIQAGLNNAKRFDTNDALDRIENIYLKVQKNGKQAW